MELRTIGDKITNEWIREQTKLGDVMERLAGRDILQLGRIGPKRSLTGDHLQHDLQTDWQQVTMDSSEWKRIREAYDQQQIETGRTRRRAQKLGASARL